MSGRTRRGGGAPPPAPDTALAMCMRHATAAQKGGAGARVEAQQAIFHLLSALGDAASPIIYANQGARSDWIDVLRFLDGCLLTKGLNGLSLALAELDRGIIAASLEPAVGGRRGGLSNTDEMQLMRDAVEAATELKARCSCVEEYRTELKESDTSYSTIEDYRKRLSRAPTELHPRSSYILTWGGEAPELLLQQKIWALRDLRKKPRSARVVET